MLLAYETRSLGQNEGLPSNPGCGLSGPAATLLHQHAVQGDLSAMQLAIAHWAGAARQNLDTTLDAR